MRAVSSASKSAASHRAGPEPREQAPCAAQGLESSLPITPAPKRQSAPIHRQAILVGLAILAVRLAYIGYTRLTYEDAYISLRYATHLAAGHGLVYNPGERVFGATTPLYVLFLSVCAALGAPSPLFLGKLLGIVADGITGGLWFAALARLTGRALPGLLFAVFFGLSPFVVEVSCSGMETPLVSLGMTCAFLATRDGRSWPMGVAMGLLALVRPDALLFVAILLGDRWLRTRRLPWREGTVALACLLPWLLFAHFYYGTWVPNSIPAKLAAYQIHQPSFMPNLLYSASFFTPFRNGFSEEVFNAVVAPLFLLGCLRIARQNRDCWPVPAFFLVHWLFLVLSRTVLFRWYFVPALLPFYVVAGLGGVVLLASAGRRGTLLFLGVALAAALLLHTGAWLVENAQRARRLQAVEERTRRAIGLWLRQNTPPGATVALEPIGYIGYYSRRRILDEVGLVSPQVIPILRAGDGWFGRLLRAEHPDYVVERPAFLHANQTINVPHLKMFADETDRAWFERNYTLIRRFEPDVAPFSPRAYHFVIFRSHRAVGGKGTKRFLPSSVGTRRNPRSDARIGSRPLGTPPAPGSA